MEISINRKPKMNPKEILELKSTIIERKIHYRDLKVDLSRQKKYSVNLKIGQWKLLRPRKRKQDGRKANRAQENCGTQTNRPTYASWKSLKIKRESGRENI